MPRPRRPCLIPSVSTIWTTGGSRDLFFNNNNNMPTSGAAGNSGRLRSSTRPNLDDRETKRARLRSRDSRRRRNLRRRVQVTRQRMGHHRLTNQFTGSRREGGGPTSTGLGGVSTPALASHGGAPLAGLSALDRAPPPLPGLSALHRAPRPDILGPECLFWPLGRGICCEMGPAGAGGRPADDPPTCDTPTPL